MTAHILYYKWMREDVTFSLPGTKPKVAMANFDDLLSGQSFAGAKKKEGPRTIAEMRKEEMAKEMDPEKLKVVLQWSIHFQLSVQSTWTESWKV